VISLAISLKNLVLDVPAVKQLWKFVDIWRSFVDLLFIL